MAVQRRLGVRPAERQKRHSWLIDIATEVPEESARQYALVALGEGPHASEALPAIVAGLKDSDSLVRFYALNAMSAITGEPSCSVPLRSSATDPPVASQTRQCLAWWDEDGKRRYPFPP